MDVTTFNLSQQVLNNTAFRVIVYTEPVLQLAVMCLPPSQDVGAHYHPYSHQTVKVESGYGVADVGSQRYTLEPGTFVVIPAGVGHNITNNSSQPLKLYTMYSKPIYPHGTVHLVRPA